MITLERSPERDAALDAMLARPAQGWTLAALAASLPDIGVDSHAAAMLFPGGTADLIAAYIDLADRRMADAAGLLDLADMRVPARIRALIATRLEQAAPHKDHVRRATAALAMPCHAGLAAACTARSVDAIWHAAGDRSAAFNWYTKRATLAGVYAATLLFWLRDTSADHSDTLAFLDRRLDGVARIGRLRRRAESLLDRLCGHLRPDEAA